MAPPQPAATLKHFRGAGGWILLFWTERQGELFPHFLSFLLS